MGKYWISLAILLFLAGSASARTTGYGCESLDVNHDRAITATDALIVLRSSVGLGEESPSFDVNHDRAVTASDSLVVLRAAVGLDSCE